MVISRGIILEMIQILAFILHNIYMKVEISSVFYLPMVDDRCSEQHSMGGKAMEINMKFKKFLSVLLALSLVVSCMTVAGTVFASGAEADAADTAAAGSAYSEMLAQTSSEGYGLSSTVNQGAILQAWSWSFANIEANLETIAEQGFTTVQVSPPNEIKKGTAGAKFLQSDNQNGWWIQKAVLKDCTACDRTRSFDCQYFHIFLCSCQVSDLRCTVILR